MLGEAQRESEDRERRVGEPGGWKGGGSGDVQVLHSVHLPVGVDDAEPWIRVHSRRAGMVVRIGVQ